MGDRRPTFCCAVLFLLLASSMAGAAEAYVPVGRNHFEFIDKRGNPDRPVTVFTYRPRAFSPDSPILFVLHGRQRNAETYCAEWERYARKYHALLVAPEFREAYYPGSSQYQLGNVYSTALLTVNDMADWTAFSSTISEQAKGTAPSPGKRVWDLLSGVVRMKISKAARGVDLTLEEKEELLKGINEALSQKDFYQTNAFPKPKLPKEAQALLGRKAKDLSLGQTRWLNRLLLDDAFAKQLQPFRYRRGVRKEWTFSVIEHLFDEIKKRSRTHQTTYLLYGHSAGGQFVQRLVLFRSDARFSLAVAANPGRYTWPTFKETWPYGMRGSGCPVVVVKRAFARELVIMAGSEDTDEDDEDLTTTPAAMKQGRNRLERARHFMAAAEKEAAVHHMELKWRFQAVEGAGHDNAQMAKAAAAVLFGEKR